MDADTRRPPIRDKKHKLHSARLCIRCKTRNNSEKVSTFLELIPKKSVLFWIIGILFNFCVN